MKHLLVLLTLISSPAFAVHTIASQPIERVDVKKQVALVAGNYSVTNINRTPKDDDLCKGLTYKWPKAEDEKLCDQVAIHAVNWGGEAADPILAIGMARTYADFNKGLITEPKDPKDACTYSHNTQSSDKRVINDDYSTCKDENISTHTTIDVKANVLEYSQVTKVSKAGKVVCIPLKCTLTKK